MRIFRRIALVLAILMVLLGCQAKANVSYNGNVVNEDNSIHFIDVGQGDSILVVSNGEYMLVDAGEEDKGNNVVSYIKALGITELKYAVATHPHSDHIGGMDDVMKAFKVDNVIMPNYSASSKCFENMLDAIESKDINVIEGKAGYSFKLGNFSCNIVGPINIIDDANNNSVVMRLVYGNDSILLTGDCAKTEEADILNSGANISATLLKVGHHGSSTSSTEAFIRRINPTVAVISCGKDNEYGHPHKETVDTLNKFGVNMLRTDELGSIVAVCSGNGITMKYGDKSTNVENAVESTTNAVSSGNTYILNTKTMKFHKPDCSGVKNMSNANKQTYTGTAQELKDKGYSPCGTCKPE